MFYFDKKKFNKYKYNCTLRLKSEDVTIFMFIFQFNKCLPSEKLFCLFSELKKILTKCIGS